MSKLRVHSFAVSIDGYGTGADQSHENPLGVGGVALREWVIATRTFRKRFGSDGGTTGVGDEIAAPHCCHQKAHGCPNCSASSCLHWRVLKSTVSASDVHYMCHQRPISSCGICIS